MKKKFVLIAGAVLPASSMSTLVYLKNENKADDLFWANVEALARSESSGLGRMCSQSGNSGNYYMVLCSNCDGNPGSYAMDYVAFCQ